MKNFFFRRRYYITDISLLPVFWLAPSLTRKKKWKEVSRKGSLRKALRSRLNADGSRKSISSGCIETILNISSKWYIWVELVTASMWKSLSTKISFLISLCLNYLLERRREQSISSWGRWQRKVVSSYDPNEIQDRTYRIFSQNFEPYLIRHERWIGREREKNIKDSDDPIPRTVGSLSYCYFFKYLST